MTELALADQANYKSKEHLCMVADLEMVRDLDGGTPAMRRKGEKYLPKFPGETVKQYQRRLQRTFLFNTYRKILNGLVGMATKNGIGLGEDVHPTVKVHLEDIDNAGTHIDVWARETLRDAMEGHCLIFIDMEKPLPAGSTKKQAEIKKRRPFWNRYRKDQAINHDRARINGEEVLTQITFEECTTVKDGRFGTKECYQYRVLYLPPIATDEFGNVTAYGPMEWELLRLTPQNTLARVDGGQTKLPRIPVVIIYTNKKGFLLSDPCLLDVGYLNVAHYQDWSDLRTQQKALVPTLVQKIVRENAGGKAPDKEKKTTQEREIATGASVAIILHGKDDEVKYLQAEGKNVEIAERSLAALEHKMSTIGLSLIEPKDSKEVTATEKVIDQGERVADLSSIARALQDGIEECLSFHAQYLGVEDENGDGGSVTVTVDPAPKREDVMAESAFPVNPAMQTKQPEQVM